MAMNPRLLRPLASGYRYASLRKGLVAYWPMNETAASGDVLVGDETGRGNHLGSVNSVLGATGKIGNGREFTAANSEYLTAAAANTDLKFADGRDWTYAGWIYVPTWTNGLIWTGNDASGNREMVATLTTVRTRSLGFELNPGGAAGVNVIAGDALALSTWHFFAFTYTHSTGVLVGRINTGSGNNTISGTRPVGALVQSANPLNLGRRQFTGANAHFGGLLDEVAKWDRVLTSAELDTLYNNGNGIDLSAPRKTFAPFPGVSNAETLDWINRVYANGGTVSTSTANAVNSFCAAIDAAGIRDRFARLNLFAGTGLNAALVPLYRSTSFGGSLVGNTTDTNVGPFVSGDYAENDGLTASATKYLNTGLSPSTVGVSTGHLSIWAKGAASSAAALGMGSRTAGAAQRYELATSNRNTFQGDAVTDFFAASAYGVTATASYQQTGDPTRPAGLYLITRTSGTQLDFYLNSTSVANSTASVTPDANANAIFVHARNNDGTAGFLGATTSRGYSIGSSMSSSQVSSFYTAWNAFQTALGRT